MYRFNRVFSVKSRAGSKHKWSSEQSTNHVVLMAQPQQLIHRALIQNDDARPPCSIIIKNFKTVSIKLSIRLMNVEFYVTNSLHVHKAGSWLHSITPTHSVVYKLVTNLPSFKGKSLVCHLLVKNCWRIRGHLQK